MFFHIYIYNFIICINLIRKQFLLSYLSDLFSWLSNIDISYSDYAILLKVLIPDIRNPAHSKVRTNEVVRGRSGMVTRSSALSSSGNRKRGRVDRWFRFQLNDLSKPVWRPGAGQVHRRRSLGIMDLMRR